jgi:predicted RNase H-like HicB family nuclease
VDFADLIRLLQLLGFKEVGGGPAGCSADPSVQSCLEGRAVTAYPIEVYLSDEDGAWIAVAPDLPHCASHGPTAHEAVAEVEDVIAAWLNTARSMGRPIPRPSLRAARA